eukprot:CAMPEP_0173177844 /NCGR_PEP_ID=MMETSP1141-20130122/5207_1 /TAXON_ID=483371 /ORGANISM="non described non described, Strain CCMP2298" /LENGTH=169 /DNA_ID=CAMNT_0014100271 /DNA_START=300 /DNA_END=809 /DNA_ORIENTATION=-
MDRSRRKCRDKPPSYVLYPLRDGPASIIPSIRVRALAHQVLSQRVPVPVVVGVVQGGVSPVVTGVDISAPAQHALGHALVSVLAGDGQHRVAERVPHIDRQAFGEQLLNFLHAPVACVAEHVLHVTLAEAAGQGLVLIRHGGGRQRPVPRSIPTLVPVPDPTPVPVFVA